MRTAVLLCTLALLVSCTSNSPTRSGEVTTPPPYFPKFGAPAVSEPIDAGAFAADPCTSLTAEQQSEFGVDGADERFHADGDSCEYTGPDDLRLFVFFSERPSGLSFLYGTNDGGEMGYWEPTEIDGRPAVAYDGADRTPYCGVAVGLSDTKYFSASTDVDPGPDICATAKVLHGRGPRDRGGRPLERGAQLVRDARQATEHPVDEPRRVVGGQ